MLSRAQEAENTVGCGIDCTWNETAQGTCVKLPKRLKEKMDSHVFHRRLPITSYSGETTHRKKRGSHTGRKTKQGVVFSKRPASSAADRSLQAGRADRRGRVNNARSEGRSWKQSDVSL